MFFYFQYSNDFDKQFETALACIKYDRALHWNKALLVGDKLRKSAA